MTKVSQVQNKFTRIHLSPLVTFSRIHLSPCVWNILLPGVRVVVFVLDYHFETFYEEAKMQ